MQQWLQRIIQWARDYLNPDIRSLNTPKPGYESGELQDDLLGGIEGSLLEALVAKETAQERQQQQLGRVNGAL